MITTQEKTRNVVWLSQRYNERDFFFASSINIVAELHSQNFKVTFVYLEKRSAAPNILESIGCKVIYLGRAHVTKTFNPFILWKLAKFLREDSIDILHCHRHKATLYGSIAAWAVGVPVVFSHVHGLNRTRSFSRRWVNRILFRRVSKVIAISDAVRNDLLASNPNLSPKKVTIIRNFIDIRKFSDVNITKQESRKMLGLPQDAFIFGTVARLVPTKGLSYLINAFAKVHRSVSNSHLVLVGSGRLESDLKRQASDLGCLDAITFAGQRNDVPKILRAFDSFVLSSINEGLGVALIEAMAASLPCVAAAVGGIPEVIVDAKVGYLVPSKDPDALAKAMIECNSISEDERRRMGLAGSDMVQTRFSEDVYVKNLKSLYENELCR